MLPWLVGGLLAVAAAMFGTPFWSVALVEVVLFLGYCVRGLQEALRDLHELRREQDRGGRP